MSSSIWREEFEWPHGKYPVSDIQDYETMHETMKLLGTANSKINKDKMVKMCLIQKLMK